VGPGPASHDDTLVSHSPAAVPVPGEVVPAVANNSKSLRWAAMSIWSRACRLLHHSIEEGQLRPSRAAPDAGLRGCPTFEEITQAQTLCGRTCNRNGLEEEERQIYWMRIRCAMAI